MPSRSGTPTLRQAQQAARERLAALPHASAELEAALLLCHLLRKPRSYLYAWPERRLSEAESESYRQLIERRLSGEPIAHITGEREFWSLPLQITPETLIPRPETELLVERALQLLQSTPKPRIADLGTGSGAIAIALASERPDAEIDAVERSQPALAVARDNACRLGYGNIRFLHGDWCEALPAGRRYDLILSNPPYIEADDAHLGQGDLPWEPASALVSGDDGLADIRQIAQQAWPRLTAGGWLLLEHGYRQAEAVSDILTEQGYQAIATHPDLAGQPRASEGRTPRN
ncbi:MAG: peptide chain release factor N(5)-glutamine methyltransferase [Candidatus Thiodiazotropha sp.]